MMRMNKKLIGALSGGGIISVLCTLMMYGGYKRTARRFAGRVGLSGELLLYDAPSGAKKSESVRKQNLSRTDAEIAHNEVMVRDLLGCADNYKPVRAAALFFACARELDRKFEDTPFEFVLYFGEGGAGAFRLCRVRADDPSWLSDNIDAYAEPIAVYRN